MRMARFSRTERIDHGYPALALRHDQGVALCPRFLSECDVGPMSPAKSLFGCFVLFWAMVVLIRGLWELWDRYQERRRGY
jgi:hypothetical protein